MRDMPANDRIECERLGLEGAELTPALASGRNSTKAGAPTVRVSDKRIEAAAFVETGRLEVGGGVVILIANTANQPLAYTVTLAPGSVEDGSAAVLFTGSPNRMVTVNNGVFTDSVDAMSTRAYRLEKTKVTTDQALAAGSRGPGLRIEPNPKNLLLNPSFEACANSEFPDGFSANVGRDPEAAVFVDSRDSVHGLHSLRLHTPSNGAGLQVLAFPPEAAYDKVNTTFHLSLWARGVGVDPAFAPTLRFGVPYYDFLPWSEPVPCTVGPAPHTGPSAACHEFSKNVTLTSEWTRYSLDVTTPSHVLNGDTSWVFFQLEGAGKALVDLIELVEEAAASPRGPAELQIDQPLSLSLSHGVSGKTDDEADATASRSGGVADSGEWRVKLQALTDNRPQCAAQLMTLSAIYGKLNGDLWTNQKNWLDTTAECGCDWWG